MKSVVTASLAFMVVAVAPTASAQLEDRLAQLQETYAREVARVTAPVDRKYHQALVSLQKALIEANELEKALEVKREIDALLAKAESKKTAPTMTATNPSPTTDPAPDKGEDGMTDLREWRGDAKRREDEGKPVIVIEGREGSTRKTSYEIVVAERFPDGLRMRFQYKSDGLPGGGIELRGDYPSQGFTYRNPTLQLDGAWHEYEWPFPDYKGEKEIVFEIHVENTDGTIMFTDIEFLDP